MIVLAKEVARIARLRDDGRRLRALERVGRELDRESTGAPSVPAPRYTWEQMDVDLDATVERVLGAAAASLDG